MAGSGGCGANCAGSPSVTPANAPAGSGGTGAGTATSPTSGSGGMAGSIGSAGVSGMAGGPAAGGAGAPPANDEGWETIISADWELGPGEERYFCQRVTLKEDLYFSAVKALNPRGTHHTALTASAAAMRPDGLTECDSSNLSPQGIFGSGVGTDPVTYPDGVGLRLRAGQQLLLNLHVYNVTNQPLRGMSGTAIKRVEAAKVMNVAESLLAGPARFTLQPGRSSVRGQCSMTHDVTLFAVQPHMHQTGVHMRAVAHSSVDGEVVLRDGEYDFERQLVYSIEEVAMKRGDKVDVECTFDNQTGGPVAFGESSDQEMCFLVLHRYPAAQMPAISCFF